MSRFEDIENKSKSLRVLALSTASSLAILAGCGDNGNSTIASCPEGSGRSLSPVTNKKSAWDGAIDKGVSELRLRIGEDAWTRTHGQKRTDLIEDPSVKEAAEAVFHKDSFGSSFYEVGTPWEPVEETQLDDTSEIFCVDDGEVYLTEVAVEGLFKLKQAGINVDLVPDYLQPESQRISAGR